MTTYIFVYGTLKPGQHRWPVLASFGTQADVGHSGRARGTLFDTGYGWPAAVFDADVASEVAGVVVSMRAEVLDEALVTLDEVEGVDSGLFQRVVIEVDGQSCWAYHWPESTDALRQIERWPSDGTRDLS